jgi:hypothetical protein
VFSDIHKHIQLLTKEHKPLTDAQRVPPPALDAGTASSALGNSSRSRDKRYEKRISQALAKIDGFLKYSDKFTVNTTLEKLSEGARTESKKEAMRHACKELSETQSEGRVYSAQYYDKNGVPLFFYFGHRRSQDKTVRCLVFTWTC